MQFYDDGYSSEIYRYSIFVSDAYLYCVDEILIDFDVMRFEKVFIYYVSIHTFRFNYFDQLFFTATYMLVFNNVTINVKGFH